MQTFPGTTNVRPFDIDPVLPLHSMSPTTSLRLNTMNAPHMMGSPGLETATLKGNANIGSTSVSNASTSLLMSLHDRPINMHGDFAETNFLGRLGSPSSNTTSALSPKPHLQSGYGIAEESLSPRHLSSLPSFMDNRWAFEGTDQLFTLEKQFSDLSINTPKGEYVTTDYVSSPNPDFLMNKDYGSPNATPSVNTLGSSSSPFITTSSQNQTIASNTNTNNAGNNNTNISLPHAFSPTSSAPPSPSKHKESGKSGLSNNASNTANSNIPQPSPYAWNEGEEGMGMYPYEPYGMMQMPMNVSPSFPNMNPQSAFPHSTHSSPQLFMANQPQGMVPYLSQYPSIFQVNSFVPKTSKPRNQIPGRSSLLEEFHNNKNANFQLENIKGYVVEFSRDQHGSRFIQTKLETATDAQKKLIFDEILPEAKSLMKDVFGNYVIQKFFEYGTEEHKNTLAECLHGSVLSLSLQVYGCRVVQKALEQLDGSHQANIIAELDEHIIECVRDQNGNHVIQKCVECSADHSDVKKRIVAAFQGQAFQFASHPYGCRVIQRILERCPHTQTTPLLNELLVNTEQLVLNQYGNYVIQHVIERGTTANRTAIVKKLRGKFVTLAQHKFASNVIEKCVQYGSSSDRDIIIAEVTEGNSLFVMTKDPFANYVVQKLLDCCHPTQREKIAIKLRPHLTTLRRFPYGKHVVSRIEKFDSILPERNNAMSYPQYSDMNSEQTDAIDPNNFNFSNYENYPPLVVREETSVENSNSNGNGGRTAK